MSRKKGYVRAVAEMTMEKGELPSYSTALAKGWHTGRNGISSRKVVRRSRFIKLLVVAFLGFITYAQWRQIANPSTSNGTTSHGLSIEQLKEDLLQTCPRLHRKPVDPVGFGRERSARYIDGKEPTLIKNATVWVGEAIEGTSAKDARAGKGYSWIKADVFLEYGLIKNVQKNIQFNDVPRDALIYDAKGRPLTSGIIDMHSHAGVHSLPSLHGNEDVSELSKDITPYVRSIDGIQPMDPQIQVIKSGGVTTSLILPGSSSNIGGEAYVIKHAVGSADGRNETSVADMLADPEQTWRYMKMACGENAKHIHGKAGERGPYSRLGESWEFRHAFEQATKLMREQDDWCSKAKSNLEKMERYLPQEIRWESLIAVLRGQVHVNVHCYTILDLEAFVDHTREFKFPVRAFHHAHQTYLVPEILKRAWGNNPPASALFADNMWYKAESYIGSEYAGKHLYDSGLTPIYVSDNPILNAQHVVFEAAKGYKYGLPYHAALASVTTAPAERLGLGNRLGKIKPGFDADVVVWDSDPLSVGAAPVQVWIDGTAQYEDPIELKKSFERPMTPDPDLGSIVEESRNLDGNVVFTGISQVDISVATDGSANSKAFNLAISSGKITCIGKCDDELKEASASGKVINLKNGHLTPTFTAFGSTLGLNAIDGERITDNGIDGETFSRGFDGLALDTKKLHASHRYGVTRAISAPKFSSVGTHHGASVGFSTGAAHGKRPGAVFARDVAVHYTLAPSVGHHGPGDSTESSSSSVGKLRQKLLEAVKLLGKEADDGADGAAYSEMDFLQKIIAGEMPLAITVHSADVISAVLDVKADVERAISAKEKKKKTIRLVLVGAAEAHLIADEIASAGVVGVILAPLFSYGESWDQRRALTGAPLTKGTGIDVIVDAGVKVAVGLDQDWVVRDLGLLAGIAYKNSEGRIRREDALGLISGKIYKILGLEEPDYRRNFVIHEGDPLEIDSRVKVIGGGTGHVTVV